MKVNDAVLHGYKAIATKYHVQDISYRAMAGRITKVTGIEIKPTELAMYMSEDDFDSLSKEERKKFAKYEKWVHKKCGSVSYELESMACPHLMMILQFFLLGFIDTKTLTREFKVTKKMLQEGGGIVIANWKYVVEEIEKHQAPRPKVKKVVAEEAKNDN